MNNALLGDDSGKRIGSGILHKINEFFELHSISTLLPFHFYDPETEIYHMQDAKGILLKADPMVGASEDNAESFYNFLQRVLPEGAIVQVLLEASPYVGAELDLYEQSRKNHSLVLEKNAQYRSQFLKEGIFKSLLPNKNHVLRDFHIYFSLIFDNKMELSENDIQIYRQKLISTLEGMKIFASSVNPQEFLQLVDSLVHPNGKAYRTPFDYNDLKTLSEQLASPHESHKVTSQRVIVNDGWDIRTFRVKDFPKMPVHLFEMDELIGSLFDDHSRIGCPFMMSFMIYIGKQSQFKDIGHYRGYRARQRAKALGNESPKAGDEAYEALNILRQIEDNERIVLADFQIFLYCKEGEGESHESTLMNVFQAPSKKWRLAKNNLLHMVSLISHMPLAQSQALFQDLEKLGILHKLWTMNAANMMPLLAEMKGGQSRRLLLMGRRGQLLFWDPFLNNRGNYNTCVAGISGSGKSVTVQEIASSFIGTGARVWIIDVGRSYKKLCHLLCGQFIEFTKEANLCLNPFSTVNSEELEEFYAFMVPLVCLMVDPNQQCSALEVSMIEQAIKSVWTSKGQDGELTDIANWLLNHPDNRAKDIGTTLYSFTKEGQYGNYFNGKANVAFDKKMVVFELEEINSNKRLQSIIFMLLMYHVTEKMYLGGRTTQMALIIDEAWDMLKGGYGGDIIESIARRARKYQGCLITITQSIADFFSSPAGMAAFKNSYWRILHLQNMEDISNLLNDKKLTLNPFQERLLRSVTTEHGKYSEMIIQGGGGEYAIARLILDPYSRILYSTKGEEYAPVEALCQQGIAINEAVAIVTERIYGVGVKNNE